MALAGNYNKITWEPSPTETEEVTLTYPADLPVEDENYNLRGQTVTKTVPVQVETIEVIENSYLMITGASLEKHDGGDFNISLAYHVYADKAARDADPNESLFRDIRLIEWDVNSDIDPITKGYEFLKTLPQCVNMVNA
jgi:hypothetical protein